jgi:exodeoxyribonuclease VII small subunit
MAAKDVTYEESIKRLEEIVAKIDNNEIDIDNLAITLKEAQKLIKSCHDKLFKVDAEVKKIFNEEE